MLLLAGLIAAAITGCALTVREEGALGPGAESSGLIIGSNTIYVAEQAPGLTVLVMVVRLKAPGFVVVREDLSGAPGAVLGNSGLIPAGETKNLAPIGLSRPTRDEETIYAMLYLDDGDSGFDAAKDKPAKDSVSGEPVMMIVTVSAEAEEPADVTV